MGYEVSKIYKLQHDDGHFYIGSTITELRCRLNRHKTYAKQHPTQRVYSHIRGEWNKIKMILIEEVSCENKRELLRLEDSYIQKELGNDLCLNHRRAFVTDEEINERQMKYNKLNKEHLNKIRKIREDMNRDVIKEQKRTYNEANKDRIKEQKQKYYQDNKERINDLRRKRNAKKRQEL
jgi:hypothetical protein